MVLFVFRVSKYAGPVLRLKQCTKNELLTKIIYNIKEPVGVSDSLQTVSCLLYTNVTVL